jgi:hypothetical protein
MGALWPGVRFTGGASTEVREDLVTDACVMNATIRIALRQVGIREGIDLEDLLTQRRPFPHAAGAVGIPERLRHPDAALVATLAFDARALLWPSRPDEIDVSALPLYPPIGEFIVHEIFRPSVVLDGRDHQRRWHGPDQPRAAPYAQVAFKQSRHDVDTFVISCERLRVPQTTLLSVRINLL